MISWKKVLGLIRERFYPASVQQLREGYSFKLLQSDLLAGLIVGVVAIPLAIAFAIASGVSPTQGLVTAVVTGLLVTLLSGSQVQIGGPTGAFIIIIYGIVAKYGYDGLAVATLMAGALLIIMGATGLGSIIKYIPYPVTVGFTAGIALVIFMGQVKDLLGLDIDQVPVPFDEKLIAYIENIDSINLYSVGFSLVTIIICVAWKRVTPKVPGSLVAIIFTTLVAFVLRHFGWVSEVDLATIGDRFPSVAEGMTIPKPRLPAVSYAVFRDMVSPAISIALLAGVESLLSAVVADGMTGRRHNSNTELIAQGVANFCSPLFGGIPATGAIARTATNIKNGGRTPVAGLVHVVLLLLVMLFLGRVAAWIPMATLAGVVAVVAYNMSEWRPFVKMFRSTRSDAAVMTATFLLTVLVDLILAIQVGVLMAVFLFVHRMAEATSTSNVTTLFDPDSDSVASEDDPLSIARREVPKGVEVFEIAGALFFGAADKFKDTLRQAGVKPRVLILRMRSVLLLDATALHVLNDVFTLARKEGTTLVLSGVNSQPLIMMQRSGFLDQVGEANVLGHIDEALARARALVSEDPVAKGRKKKKRRRGKSQDKSTEPVKGRGDENA